MNPKSLVRALWRKVTSSRPTAVDRKVLAILMFAASVPTVFATNEALAARLGCSAETARRAKARGEQLGLWHRAQLRRRDGGNKAAELHIDWEWVRTIADTSDCVPPLLDLSTPPPQAEDPSRSSSLSEQIPLPAARDDAPPDPAPKPLGTSRQDYLDWQEAEIHRALVQQSAERSQQCPENPYVGQDLAELAHIVRLTGKPVPTLVRAVGDVTRKRLVGSITRYEVAQKLVAYAQRAPVRQEDRDQETGAWAREETRRRLAAMPPPEPPATPEECRRGMELLLSAIDGSKRNDRVGGLTHEQIFRGVFEYAGPIVLQPEPTSDLQEDEAEFDPEEVDQASKSQDDDFTEEQFQAAMQELAAMQEARRRQAGRLNRER